MADVAMPRLSDSMEEGTILKWLKSDGDEVKRGDELVEIETDKANMTYEADEDGVAEIVGLGGRHAAGRRDDREHRRGRRRRRRGAEARTRTSRARRAEDEQPEAEPQDEERRRRGGARRRGADDSEEPTSPSAATRSEPDAEERTRSRATTPARRTARVRRPRPIARRMARELGLELAALEGTGPGGRIVKADVEAAAGGRGRREPRPPAAEGARRRGAAPAAAARRGPARRPDRPRRRPTQELTRLQRTVARRMAESKATAPDFVLNVEVDMEEAVELRKQLKAAAGERPRRRSTTSSSRPRALALTRVPARQRRLPRRRSSSSTRASTSASPSRARTRSWSRRSSTPTASRSARSPRETRALAEKVREGKITPPELSAGTFTVSNLGMYGIDRFVAGDQPAAGGDPRRRRDERRQPVVRDGEVIVRTRMALTLVCDHRILYGADAAEFLARIRERLEHPLSLAL